MEIYQYNSEDGYDHSNNNSSTEYVTEVTHTESGVTYHFSDPVEVGYYWNGDIFVVNNSTDITITKITPDSNPLSEGRVLNGAVLQPDNKSFTSFDSEGQPDYYRDYTTFEAYNIDPGKTGQPIVVKYDDHPGGASLVKSVSLEDLSDSRDRSAIEEFSVLTIVADIPPENAFRPPVSGTDKVSHYTTDNLDFSKLQNVEILDSQKDIGQFDLYKTATFASWTTSGDPARYTHPNKYHDGYGDYQMDAMTYAFMALHSDYSDAEKADLYAALVQTGIDYAGTVQAGKAWNALGGLNNQIKPFVVLAAVGLNSEDLADAADPATNGYSEDKQFRYVDESLIGAESFDWGGSKLPKFGEEYQDAHLGRPEWFIVEGGDRADPSLDAAYRWINSNNLPITALTMEMLGNGEGREIWNNEAYFDYADRIQNITDIELYKARHKPQDAWIDFVDAYAQQFSTKPDWVGVPEAVSNLEAEANGAGITVRINGPKYDGGSEIIRTDFRYSTDRENWEVLEDVSSEFAVLGLPENSLFFIQARHVNANGEGPWTGNSFNTTNQGIVRELLASNIITEDFIIQNGDYIRFTTTSAYKEILRDLLDVNIESNELEILSNYVNGTIVTGEGLSFISGSKYIDENVEIGTIVGTLNGMDGDNVLSYQMIEPSEYFEIDGLNIITKSEINYEEHNEHQIDVRVFGNEDVYEEKFTIRINNVAEAVTDFVVSINDIPEDTAVGTVVGTFSAYDADGEDITFKSSGNPAYDNSTFREYFDIVDDQVILIKSLDKDAFSSLNLLFYTSTPSGLGLNWTTYKINIVEPSEPEPTAVTDFVVSIDDIPEDTAVGTVVGTFSAYDADGEDITFKSSGNPAYDNSTFREYFDIIDDQVILIKSLDKDAFSSLSLVFYTSTPSGLGLNWTTYKINIVEPSSIDEDPAEPVDPKPVEPEVDEPTAVTDFVVSIDDIPEDTAVGTVVGTFSAYDADGEDITFKSSGNPAYDNSTFREYFDIVDDQVILIKSLDKDAFSSLSLVFYTSTPSGLGLNWTTYKINIVEPSEPEPTAVTDFVVSIDDIPEDTAVGTVVGTFSAYDADGEDITFKSSGNPAYDNSTFREYFDIVDDQVILIKSLDKDAFSSLSLVFYTSTPSGLGLNWTTYKINIVEPVWSKIVPEESETNPENLMIDPVGPTPVEPETEAPKDDVLIRGKRNADDISGGLGDDTLVGGGGEDTLRGGGGEDRLAGGRGQDVLMGGNGDDRLSGGRASDMLNGSAGADRLLGKNGDDRLDGGHGSDILRGGGGADSLEGNEGRDILIGGKGVDIFIFGDDFGQDRLVDFDANREVLDFSQHSRVDKFDDLTITQGSAGVIVANGAGGRLMLSGMDLADIDETDFLF